MKILVIVSNVLDEALEKIIGFIAQLLIQTSALMFALHLNVRNLYIM